MKLDPNRTFITIVIIALLLIVWVKMDDITSPLNNNDIEANINNENNGEVNVVEINNENLDTGNEQGNGEIVVGDNDARKIKLETNQGDIILEMRTDMPITTGNFVKLVSDGFYDGVIFHRVIDGFMIQGGDPEGTGRGGPGYTIEDEFPTNNKNDRGTISMANAGPNTGGSQFFINLVNNNFLDGKHPAFGEVIEGMEVVDKIAKGATDGSDRPLTEVVIEKASVIS